MQRLLPLLVIFAVVLGVGSFAGPAVAATGGSTLVFGANDNGYEGDNVASTLRDLGVTVDRRATLPADLSSYRSVWYISAYAGLSDGDADRLASYVNGGGSAYLTGERPCCETLNAGVQRVLRQVLKDQDVQVGGLGDINGPFTFNSDVTDHVARVPNRLTDFVPQSPGGMQGVGDVSSHNVFASNGSTAVGAVWSEADMKAGQGRIALLMDIDWLGSPSRLPIIENIQNFLSDGGSCSNTESPAGVSWSLGTPQNCSTLLEPQTFRTTITGQPVNGDVVVTTSATAVTADCTTSSQGVAKTTVSCTLSGADATGGRLKVTATTTAGQSVRTFRVLPKNDPRNVPPGFGQASNWWQWPDTDKDGIPDYWEEHGVWVKNVFWNLPAEGVSTNRKDLFVRYDYLDGHELPSRTYDDMRAMFDNAPVSNVVPARNGINLHISSGSAVPSTIAGTLDDIDPKATDPTVQRITTYSGFASSPQAGGPGVPQLSKWMFNFDTTGTSTIGTAEVGGFDAWTAYPLDRLIAVLGTKIQLPDDAVALAQASNSAHELGHTLGLLHHGAHPCIDPTIVSVIPPGHRCDKDDRNYRSIMSYAYSNFGLPGAINTPNHIDYSRESMVNLDWTVGKGAGHLTFVPGQWGEVPNFYANSANEVNADGSVPDAPPVETEPSPEQSFRDSAPDAVRAFVSTFDIAADPDIPALATPGAVTVHAGDAVDVPLTVTDRSGGPYSFAVDGTTGGGSATGSGDGVRYEAAAGESGDVVVSAHASNPTLGSRSVDITIHVLPAPPAPTPTPTPTVVPVAGTPDPTPAPTGPPAPQDAQQVLGTTTSSPPAHAEIRAKRIARRHGLTIHFQGFADATPVTVRWVRSGKHSATTKVKTTIKRNAAVVRSPSSAGSYTAKVTIRGVLVCAQQIRVT